LIVRGRLKRDDFKSVITPLSSCTLIAGLVVT